MKFRKKPVVVNAVQITERWFEGPYEEHIVGIIINPMTKTCSIPTLEGVMTGNLGDWIIKGVNGEYYPCKPDIFEKTYEKVEE